jgi:glutathione S-transferase
MIVYGSSLSPYVRKVLAFAAEKSIEVELQPTGFPNPSAEYLEASPFRKMPALRDGDYLLADSSAIVTYLEAKHPEPALIPADAQSRGKTIWYEEFADTILTSCGGKIFFNLIVAPRFLGRAQRIAACPRLSGAGCTHRRRFSGRRSADLGRPRCR